MGDVLVLGSGEHLLSDRCEVFLLSAYLLSKLQNLFCRPKPVAVGCRWIRDLEVYIVA